MNEPNTTTNDRRATAWEQHFSTIANAIMVSGVLFLGSQVWSTNTKLTEFTVTNKYLVESVNELKVQIRDMNLNYASKIDIKDLADRVRALEIKNAQK